MKYKCEKCDHEGVTSDDYALIINSVLNWEKNASSSLVENLKKKEFRKITGKDFETLFISAVRDNSIANEIVNKSETIQQFFDREILPVLERVNSKFKVIGHVSLPAALDLAQTDLNRKQAVFCFPVVEYTGWRNALNQPVELMASLREIDLPYLLNEGSVDTLNGTSWSGAYNPTNEELMRKLTELQIMLEKK